MNTTVNQPVKSFRTMLRDGEVPAEFAELYEKLRTWVYDVFVTRQATGPEAKTAEMIETVLQDFYNAHLEMNLRAKEISSRAMTIAQVQPGTLVSNSTFGNSVSRLQWAVADYNRLVNSMKEWGEYIDAVTN